jgi:flagellar biosynthetic protein FliQ
MDDVSIAVDLAREMFWVALKIGAPVVLVGLGVGIAVSLVQSFTQIQEASVSVVPKILAVGITLIVLLPWAMYVLVDYTREVMGGMGQWLP